VHDALYENQDRLSVELYRMLAKELVLYEPGLDTALKAGS
jgi:hypothetical protein